MKNGSRKPLHAVHALFSSRATGPAVARPPANARAARATARVVARPRASRARARRARARGPRAPARAARPRAPPARHQMHQERRLLLNTLSSTRPLFAHSQKDPRATHRRLQPKTSEFRGRWGRRHCEVPVGARAARELPLSDARAACDPNTRPTRAARERHMSGGRAA